VEFCNGTSTQKTSLALIRRWKEYDNICIRFDTVTECDGQTDGRTDRLVCDNRLRRARIGMLMHHNKSQHNVQTNALNNTLINHTKQ